MGKGGGKDGGEEGRVVVIVVAAALAAATHATSAAALVSARSVLHGWRSRRNAHVHRRMNNTNAATNPHTIEIPV